MIRKNTSLWTDDRAIAMQILTVLAFIGLVALLYIAFSPAMGEMGDVADEVGEDTYYEEDAGWLTSIVGALSGPGMLVLAVLMAVVFLIARAVLFTQFR